MIHLIETGGPPYPIGLDVGRAARHQIETAAASTRADFAPSNDERVAERLIDRAWGTIGSVVIDVTNRNLWACSGNPCRCNWREVRA